MTVTIYESDIPAAFVPSISVFDFLFPPRAGISTVPDLDPASVAFIDGLSGDALCRGELKESSLRLKTGLNSLGVKRGGTACLWGLNTFHWIIAAYGCMATGLTVSPANAA
jgi:acyl-CoA synthetase (AMP-forming)/AMP-acid ligase II